MRRKRRIIANEPKVDEGLLRSINVEFDAEYPQRIAHFRPTTKSARVLEALLGLRPERAFLVTAPYGSGKSLVAAFAAHVVENRVIAKPTIQLVSKRLEAVRSSATARITSRVQSKTSRGLALALHGAQRDLSVALANAATASLRRSREGRGRGRFRRVKRQGDLVSTIAEIFTAAEVGGFDAVLLVWDEFGRHLETLLAEGRAAELHELQTLAEIASRKSKVPLTIGLLTHRGVSQYASAAPQAIRAEWTKVEGRFQLIDYIDDSKEMYRLVAEVIQERRVRSPDSRDRTWLAKVSRAARHVGVLRDLTVSEIARLSEMAFPMHPVALYALPRIASRISQNERTIFDYLSKESFSQSIGLGRVYDFFSDSMRADTGAGGCYRQYLETEAAIRRAETEEEIGVLKSACLLGLGLSGERGHVSRERLRLATTLSRTHLDPEATIQELINRKLLLFRRHSNDVSVWHGTDVDLRGALESEKERHRTAFNLVEFLRRELPAPTWRPVQFNDQFSIKRYFAGRYVTLQQLQAAAEQPHSAVLNRAGSDGLILFVVAESQADQDRAKKLAQDKGFGSGVIAAIPQREIAIVDPALEVACLEQMLRDTQLIERDPLVEVELRQLLDDARGYLHQAVSKQFTPGSDGPSFWHGGVELEATSSAEFRAALSKVTKEIYSSTPRINNEMINRRKVSAIVTNARKKLEMAILERTGIENLGIEGNFPDASIFRTVLRSTGIYRNEPKGVWRFAYPHELADGGLRNVWEILRAFFQDPGNGRQKSFDDLFSVLSSPPIGLRAGVLPVLLASAFRAFPAAISLRWEGAYVNDILPSVIEDICRHPSQFTLEVLSPSSRQASLLQAINQVFSAFDPNVTEQVDQVRRAFDSLRSWVASLPQVALLTERLSNQATVFREKLTSESDPVQLIFASMSEILEGATVAELSDELTSLRTELEGVIVATKSAAANIVRRTLDARLDNDSATVRDACRRWAKCFSIPDLQRAGGAQAVAFITRLEQRYESDDLFIDSLASQLVGQPTARWTDTTIVQFDRSLSEIVRTVEDEAVRLATTGLASEIVKANLARLIEARIGGLYANLCALKGAQDARESISGLVDSRPKRKVRGNNTRSAG